MRIRASTLVLVACLAGGTATAGGPVQSAPPPDTTKAAATWNADAVLHESMEHIEAAVQGYEHFEHGHMDARQAEILSGLIESRVATIISNCRLEPAADAALHEMLHALIDGAGALRREPTSAAAIASMREAVASYRTLFAPPVGLAPATDEPEERR